MGRTFFGIRGQGSPPDGRIDPIDGLLTMDVPEAEFSLGNEESEPAGSLFCCLPQRRSGRYLRAAKPMNCRIVFGAAEKQHIAVGILDLETA